MAIRRILYVLALLGCLIFYGAYQLWFSWLLLLVVLLLPWLSLLLSLGAMLRVKAEPDGPDRIPMGSEAKMELRIISPNPEPPIRSKIQITKPNTGKIQTLSPGTSLPTNHCGGLIAQLSRPKVFDYLGLLRLKIRKTSIKTILILPEPVKMDIPPDLSHYLAQSWRPKSGGGYAENHELRLYRPGDNLNQIHWKLSAKTGDLILREPMEPDRGLMLLTMDLCGTEEELDIKFGRLLWLGSWMLEQQIGFDIRVLTGSGVETRTIRDEWDLQRCVDELLCAPAAAEGTIRDLDYAAAWQYYIGGDPDET